MPTQDVLVSLKFNNYNYAPGIATYGIDGKTGESGKDGNNIYFTDFNLKDITDLKYFASQLVQNYLPLENSTVQIERTYKNNDLFFDLLGIIYRLKNIESLLNNDSLTSWDSYFDIAGRLSIANNSSLFTMMDDNRLILNSSLYGGYDIISGLSYNDASNNINKNSVVNIISNKVNENNDIEMINIQSIDDIDVEDGKLSVYYKTTENAFYLDSNKPIIINGDVKLNNEEPNIEYDNYSTILTSSDTISYFKHICDKLRYNILYDSNINRYKLVIYQEDSKKDQLLYLVNRKDTIFGKVYTGENEQILLLLNNIIDATVDSSKYYDYLPLCNVEINNDTILTNSFTIGDYSILNSDIIVKPYNANNVSIYLENNYIARGIATNNPNNPLKGGDTIDNSKVIGNYILNNALQKNLVAPFGIAFGGPMQSTKNYIEINPTGVIDETTKIILKVYKVQSTGNVMITIKDSNNTIIASTSINLEASDDTSLVKNIKIVEFNNLLNISGPIRIGFSDGTCRLNEYQIINDTNWSLSEDIIKRLLLNEVFTIKIEQLDSVNNYGLEENNEELFNLNDNTEMAINITLYGNMLGNNIYKFLFDIKNTNIKCSIYPLATYITENNVSPISFKLSFDDTSLINGLYTLYFELERNESVFALKNIMLFKETNLDGKYDKNYPCIETYLPNNIGSVQRFSLLHNTEVFINYQE